MKARSALNHLLTLAVLTVAATCGRETFAQESNRFELNWAAGGVVDWETGLVWGAVPEGNLTGNFLVETNLKLDWYYDYPEALGLRDWRYPTLNELTGAVAAGVAAELTAARYSPPAPYAEDRYTQIFGFGIFEPGHYYWTSEPLKRSQGMWKGWCVRPADGHVWFISGSVPVLPVRSLIPPPPPTEPEPTKPGGKKR